MADISRGDSGEHVGPPTHTPHTTRRGKSSFSAASATGTATTTRRSRGSDHDTVQQQEPRHDNDDGSWNQASETFCFVVILGFLWRFLNLWALQWASGVDLPAAMYRPLAGILVGNIVAYELLRTLVCQRKKVARTVCSGLDWVRALPRAAGAIIASVVLRILQRVVVCATASLKFVISEITKGIRRTVCVMLRAVEMVIGFAAGLFNPIMSNMRNGARRSTSVVVRGAEGIWATVNCLRETVLSINNGARLRVCAMPRAAGRIVRYATGFLTTALSDVREGAMGIMYTVLRVVDTVIAYAAASTNAVISNTREGVRRAICVLLRAPRGVVVYAANFATTNLCQRRAASRRPVANEHPGCPTQGGGQGTAHAKEDRHRAPTPARLPTSAASKPTHTTPPQATSRMGCQGASERESTGRDGDKMPHYRTSTLSRLSMMVETRDAPPSEHVRAEHPPLETDDNVVTSSKPPHPEVGVHRAMKTGSSSQGRYFSHFFSGTDAQRSREHLDEPGGCDSESRQRVCTTSKEQPRAQERGEVSVQSAVKAGTSMQGRYFSYLLPGTDAQPSREHFDAPGSCDSESRQRVCIARKGQPRAQERGEVSVQSAVKSGRSTQGRYFSYLLPGTDAQPPPGHNGYTGICANNVGNRRRVFALTQEEPIKLEPAVRSDINHQGRYFSHLLPVVGTPQSREHNDKPGGCAKVSDKRNQIFAVVEGESRTRERGYEPIVEEKNIRKVKIERSTDDNSSSNMDYHDGMATPQGPDESSARTRTVDGFTRPAPPRGSIGSSRSSSNARSRATKNTSGKQKRRRSTDESNAKSAKRRRRTDQVKKVHCCEADPEDAREMWAYANNFDKEGNAVPGRDTFFPVTLIRQSKRAAADDGADAWYVQPGGRNLLNDWNEGGRIILKVPAEELFPKVPAESGKGCTTCGRTQGQISLSPNKLAYVCDFCADASGRALLGDHGASDLGYKRARACRCES